MRLRCSCRKHPKPRSHTRPEHLSLPQATPSANSRHRLGQGASAAPYRATPLHVPQGPPACLASKLKQLGASSQAANCRRRGCHMVIGVLPWQGTACAAPRRRCCCLQTRCSSCSGSRCCCCCCCCHPTLRSTAAARRGPAAAGVNAGQPATSDWASGTWAGWAGTQHRSTL